MRSDAERRLSALCVYDAPSVFGLVCWDALWALQYLVIV